MKGVGGWVRERPRGVCVGPWGRCVTFSSRCLGRMYTLPFSYLLVPLFCHSSICACKRRGGGRGGGWFGEWS